MAAARRGAIGDFGFLLADFACFARGGFFEREGDGARQQIAVHLVINDAIDDAFGQRAFGADVLAQRAEFHGRSHAAQTRQPLRAARAGNDTQQHFGLADFGARHGHAVVAGHGKLQAAAQRGAVNGAHYRLGRILDTPQQCMHAMRAVDGDFAIGDGSEDLDIGPGDESVARSDQHDGLGGRVGGGARDARVDAFRHARAERIHGRIVYGDDGNVVLDGIMDEFWHGMSIRSIMPLSRAPARRLTECSG